MRGPSNPHPTPSFLGGLNQALKALSVAISLPPWQRPLSGSFLFLSAYRRAGRHWGLLHWHRPLPWLTSMAPFPSTPLPRLLPCNFPAQRILARAIPGHMASPHDVLPTDRHLTRPASPHWWTPPAASSIPSGSPPHILTVAFSPACCLPTMCSSMPGSPSHRLGLPTHGRAQDSDLVKEKRKGQRE